MMMKTELNPIKLLAMLFVAIGLVLFTSCGDDDGKDKEPDPTQTLMELINTTPGLDSLAKYASNYPDIVGVLSGTGDNTIFAPNNLAFANLLATPGFPPDISFVNPEIIKGVLFYHISSTRYEKEALTSGTQVASYQGEAIVINADGTLKTGSSNQVIEITEADVKATNGVMHIVASVLIPPTVGQQLTPLLGTNGGALLLSASFTVLAQGIQLADAFASQNSLPTLLSTLTGSASHTVFAPSDQTFAAGNLTASSFTGQQWYGIINNHIVLQPVLLEDITDTETSLTGKTFTSALTADGVNFNKLFFFYNAQAAKNGIGVFIDSDLDVLSGGDPTDPTVWNAEVALPNAAVNSNGRIHVIAGILSPKQ
jgi:transforming growth factor-beta-induced protein